MQLLIPPPVLSLLSRLTCAGFGAYVVGGCVRDALLGLEPHDWDICTSALPEEMRTVFSGEHLLETGLKHGTLTVVLDHVPYEITTFRTDGAYTDHRHPDAVSFVRSLGEDLARRDFTVNAMACSAEGRLEDPFGGREDLAAQLIRCVGDPFLRFQEDALRILRALRFASVYDFRLHPETASALRQLAPTLSRIAPERIREELLKLLCGKAAGRILRDFPEVFAEVIPPLRPMIGYDQNNHHHLYNLWEHTVRALEEVPPEADLRMTMLLHDTGKPESRVDDARGESHYPRHQAASARIASDVLRRLRFDSASQERITLLVANHDIPLRDQEGHPRTDRRFILHRLNRFGERDLRALFLIHRADRIATGYSTPEKEDRRLRDRLLALDRVLADRPCYTLSSLAVNGDDLLARGYRGKQIGKGLQFLLEAVMAGHAENRKEDLLDLLDRTPDL